MPKEAKKNNKESESDEFDKDFSELLKEREKKEDIDESLKEIFQAEEPAVVIAAKNKDNYNQSKNNIMKTIERREIDTWKKITRLFFALLIILAGISWTSFLIFNQGSRLDAKDIELKMTGPETATAGQEAIYEIRYKNLSQFNLKNVEIYVNYPDSFIFTDAVPAPDTGKHLWKIEQIDNKRSGRIEFKGRLVALPDTTAAFAVAITYRPENFSSTFSADAGLTTAVNSIGLNIATEAPSFFNINEETEILIKYAKQKENFIDNFLVLFERGENFAVSNSSASGPWAVGNISDTQQKFAIKGKFLKQPAEGEKLKLSLAVAEEVKSGVGAEQKTQIKNHVFYEYEWSPVVVEGALNLNLTVNGSNADKPLNFGDSLNYVIHYKNTSAAALKNIIIMASVDSPVIDWQTLQDEQKGEVKNNSIIWTKEQIRSLTEIKAGAEDSFSFVLKIKSRSQIKDISLNDLQVQTSLDYSIDSALKNADSPLVKIVNKINSDLSLANEVRYFDRNNLAIGEGPLPPKVGQKTSFHVYFILTNSLHDLENIEVTAALPANVAWNNSYANMAGQVNYQNEQRLISWKISSLDAAEQPAMLDFVISITPQANDKNKILTLLNQPQITARDKETGGAINLTGKAKTTNLEDDAVGKGQGKVE